MEAFNKCRVYLWRNAQARFGRWGSLASLHQIKQEQQLRHQIRSSWPWWLSYLESMAS